MGNSAEDCAKRLTDTGADVIGANCGDLDKKTIELIAIAVSICVNCTPCADFHIDEAIQCGATSEEINKVFKIVMAVSAGKTKVFSRALKSDF